MNRIEPQEVAAAIEKHGLRPERLLYFHLGQDGKPCACGLTAACIGRSPNPAEAIATLSRCGDDKVVTDWADRATGSVCYVRGYIEGFDWMGDVDPDYLATREAGFWEFALPFSFEEFMAGFADGKATAELVFSKSGERLCQSA